MLIGFCSFLPLVQLVIENREIMAQNSPICVLISLISSCFILIFTFLMQKWLFYLK